MRLSLLALSSAAALTTVVQGAVSDFAEAAPQADDITVLVFRYIGQK